MHLSDTIAAVASPPGGAARGIVRVSGPRALSLVSASFIGPDLTSLHQPTALPGQMGIAGLHAPLPVTLYCWPDERSYTRQPVVEIHTLGSQPLLQSLLQHVLQCGARLAEPGEFTLRAFLAGRLDLTQAEAVLGLIDARHEQQFNTALAQLAGGVSGPLGRLREELLGLLAHLEAGLDFATEDIQFITPAELATQLTVAARHVADLAAQMHGRLETNETPRVVLYGWPNVGKSSLFNALSHREHALVSPSSGTTRDYLIAELCLSGTACRLVDTAGVEQALGADVISAAAQDLRNEQQLASHLRVLCLDSTRCLNAWERRELAAEGDGLRLVVMTKSDALQACQPPPGALATSAVTGAGLDLLRERIAQALSTADCAALTSTAARCRESLDLASGSLQRARELVAAGGFEELVAAELRSALVELGKVVGVVYTDDILDRVFSRFCIGK